MPKGTHSSLSKEKAYKFTLIISSLPYLLPAIEDNNSNVGAYLMNHHVSSSLDQLHSLIFQLVAGDLAARESSSVLVPTHSFAQMHSS